MSILDSHLFSRDAARARDADDPLASFRSRFHIPVDSNGHPLVYLAGNSLGLQPTSTADYVQQELADWKRLGVEGHFHARHPWMPYHEFVTEPMARIVGALPSETVVMNSLTVNLHLLLVSFYRPSSSRYKIVIEADAFPSDQYAVASQTRFHGFDPEDAVIRLKPRPGKTTLHTDDILNLIDQEGSSIAAIMLGGVNYYTGQVFDMKSITQAGHAAGCIVGFDLAHAAGNIELSLHDWNVDFACWCTYKYLNSGPGGIAGAFVHERHATDDSLPRFAGWWGHDKSTRFEMPDTFVPLSGAEGWQLSNPPILQLAALRASLDVFDEVGMPALTGKSRKLTGYMETLIQSCDDVEIITPGSDDARGCQLSMRIAAGRKIFDALPDLNIICDWREPDVVRAAPVPLYNSFEDVYRFYEVIRQLTGNR